MSYEQMSDFEINKAVAEALHGSDAVHADGCGERFLHVINNDGMWSPDYCNNPADAWPVIFENNISLVSPTARQVIKGICVWAADHDSASRLWIKDKNPLRAAMIVFLMMQEGK